VPNSGGAKGQLLAEIPHSEGVTEHKNLAIFIYLFYL
jgi:hypothetical protein